MSDAHAARLLILAESIHTFLSSHIATIHPQSSSEDISSLLNGKVCCCYSLDEGKAKNCSNNTHLEPFQSIQRSDRFLSHLVPYLHQSIEDISSFPFIHEAVTQFGFASDNASSFIQRLMFKNLSVCKSHLKISFAERTSAESTPGEEFEIHLDSSDIEYEELKPDMSDEDEDSEEKQQQREVDSPKFKEEDDFEEDAFEELEDQEELERRRKHKRVMSKISKQRAAKQRASAPAAAPAAPLVTHIKEEKEPHHWTVEEDKIYYELVRPYLESKTPVSWIAVAAQMPASSNLTPQQCRCHVKCFKRAQRRTTAAAAASSSSSPTASATSPRPLPAPSSGVKRTRVQKEVPKYDNSGDDDEEEEEDGGAVGDFESIVDVFVNRKKKIGHVWTPEEEEIYHKLVTPYIENNVPAINWIEISSHLDGITGRQCQTHFKTYKLHRGIVFNPYLAAKAEAEAAGIPYSSSYRRSAPSKSKSKSGKNKSSKSGSR